VRRRLCRVLPLLALAGLLVSEAARGAECPDGRSPDPAAIASWKAHQETAAEAKATPPPAGHPMAAITTRMRPHEVWLILGVPDNVWTYQTPKAWLLGGSDSYRTDFVYRNAGRVVFSHEKPHEAGFVSRVDFNPDESAQHWLTALCAHPPTVQDGFGRVQPGISDIEVRALLGRPDSVEIGHSARSMIPGRSAEDVITVWTYEGLGTVSFFSFDRAKHINVMTTERLDTAAQPSRR